MSHFCDKDFNPVFEILAKNGNPRKPDIKDARRLQLYPSVTTVCSAFNREALNQWREEQCVKAAISNPQLEDESWYAYMGRVREISKEDSKKAMDYGSLVHEWIENKIKGTPGLFETPLIPQETKSKISEYLNLFTNCKSEVKLHGYGNYNYFGTTDLICTYDSKKCIVDFKTQRTATKITYYDEWIWQGAAYCKAAKIDNFISMVISSDEPGRVELKEYTKEEVDEGFSIFQDMLSLYYKKNKLK
jgi:hypothetical protein